MWFGRDRPKTAPPPDRRPGKSVSPRADAQLAQARRGNFPLLSPDRKLMILWSPKAACTTTYAWFCHLEGTLQEMREFAPWPHEHRIKVYRHSAERRRAIEEDFDDYLVLKILRDPLERAVSSFRHALRYGLADEPMRIWSDGRLGAASGYSFSDFLGMLEAFGVDRGDPHFRPQWHPMEERWPPAITIDITRRNLFAELNAVERRLGSPTTDFAALGWLHAMEKARRPARTETGAVDDRTRLTRVHAGGTLPWPPAACLLTPSAVFRLRRLYASDFERYWNVFDA